MARYKIWIGDDEELGRAVLRKLHDTGYRWASGKSLVGCAYSIENIQALYFSDKVKNVTYEPRTTTTSDGQPYFLNSRAEEINADDFLFDPLQAEFDESEFFAMLEV